MSYQNNEILAPVGLGDIANAVGIGGTIYDLGTCCQNTGNNKWAKYKSFRYNAAAFAFDGTQSTPALRQPARETALKSKNCGLAMKRYTNSTTAWTEGVALAHGGTNWVHAYPRGLTNYNEWFRALDYDGYLSTAVAPFQYAPFPNPAWRQNTIVVNDAGATGTADIELSDLQGDGTAMESGSSYYYFDIRSYTPYVFMAKKPTASTSAATPEKVFPISSTADIRSHLSASSYGWDYVVLFSSVSFTTGNYQEANGYFVLAPVGHSTFMYYDRYPFNDNGSYRPYESGVATLYVVIKLKVMQALSYTSLGVQFYKNGNWSSTVSIYSAAGTLSEGQLIQTNVNVPTGFVGPASFRVVYNGSADTQSWTIQQSPTE